jgi:hypothetical protein
VPNQKQTGFVSGVSGIKLIVEHNRNHLPSLIASCPLAPVANDSVEPIFPWHVSPKTPGQDLV